MTTSLYLASAEPRSGKSAVAVGVLEPLVRQGGRVGVFRPIVETVGDDPLLDLLLPRATSSLDATAACGVTYDAVNQDRETAVGTIVDRFHHYAEEHDIVLVVGSDFTDVASPTEFSINVDLAAHLNAPMALIVPATDRSPHDVAKVTDLVAAEATARHARVAAVIVNQVSPDLVDATHEAMAARSERYVVHVLPSDPTLASPTMRDLMVACDGTLLHGDPELLDREALTLVIAGMTLPNVLDRLVDGAALICPSDREEILLGALQAHQSTTFPTLAGIILNGGFEIPEQIGRLVEGLSVTLPLITVPGGTMSTATAASQARSRITTDTVRKIEAAVSLMEHVDVSELLPSRTTGPTVITPLMFEHHVTELARASQAHIVLPEGYEERMLRAADIVLQRGIARLTLLGDEDQIRAKAIDLGLRIEQAAIIDPAHDGQVELFAQAYAALRAHKGVTVDHARDTVVDPSYFGTLMVHSGAADGMVSGSVTTTAHTVRPALEVIRTAPNVSVVSSVFFMCLADRVLVYGDCAINPDPTAEQLADIALSSAATAQQFGVEPRVAMLSYSTGSSGSGADVDKVARATELVRQRDPDLLVEGPIQYDAAVDPSVAATKLPDSAVAGRATVLIFPNLNTGNNTYKAVQRSADAVAIGPVMQGLNKPVNDLSRGATVRDIVNTIAITAGQTEGAS